MPFQIEVPIDQGRTMSSGQLLNAVPLQECPVVRLRVESPLEPQEMRESQGRQLAALATVIDDPLAPRPAMANRAEQGHQADIFDAGTGYDMRPFQTPRPVPALRTIGIRRLGATGPAVRYGAVADHVAVELGGGGHCQFSS